MKRCSLVHGGLEQKPSTSARIWYGVQQATNAPNMKEIVRKAFLARFSDLLFCRPMPINGTFFFPFSLLPIDRMKSRFRLPSVVVATFVPAISLVIWLSDGATVESVTVGFLFSSMLVLTVVAVLPLVDVWEMGVNCVGLMFPLFGLMLLLLLLLLLLGNLFTCIASSKFEVCGLLTSTIVVTGLSGFSETLTVVLYLLITLLSKSVSKSCVSSVV